MSEAEAEVLRHLAFINTVEKSFDDEPQWREVPSGKTAPQLELNVAIRLGGVLRGGAVARLRTPRHTWEKDVYAQIEVAHPLAPQRLRLCPVEWRPKHDHRNPFEAPPSHRGRILRDRYHPYDLNEPLGIPCFRQHRTGIAVPLPRAITTFREYADLLAELWNCPDAGSLKVPPWDPRLEL